jgi:hypothetical protein
VFNYIQYNNLVNRNQQANYFCENDICVRFMSVSCKARKKMLIVVLMWLSWCEKTGANHFNNNNEATKREKYSTEQTTMSA